MRILRLLLICLAVPALAEAQSVTWTIDPGHSEAQFTVRHMLVANVHGEFDGPTGTVTFDPKNLVGTIQVDALLATKTITTRNTDRDQDLRSPNFFDVTRFPTIEFKSKRAEAVAPGQFKLIGDLTMHGVTKEVTLDVEGPTPQIKDTDGMFRVGASASTTVNRWDFGLKYNELLETGGAIVASDVHITIDLEIMRK